MQYIYTYVCTRTCKNERMKADEYTHTNTALHTHAHIPFTHTQAHTQAHTHTHTHTFSIPSHAGDRVVAVAGRTLRNSTFKDAITMIMVSK